MSDSVIRTLRPDRQRVFLTLGEHAIAYARVPKAANSAIKLALWNLVTQGAEPPAGFNTDRFWRQCSHARADMLNLRELTRLHPDAFIFSFTRNPFSRVASCYYDKIVLRRKPLSTFFVRNGFSRDMSFARFVEKAMPFSDALVDKHLESQASILTRRGRPVTHFIGRTETIEHDWPQLQAALRKRGGPALPGLEFYHSTRTMRPPTIELYADTGLVRLVRDRYAADFELFYPEMDTPR